MPAGSGLYADAMPTTRNRGAAVAVATLGLLLSGALAGCSVSKDDEPDKRDTSTLRADAHADRRPRSPARRRPRRRPRHGRAPPPAATRTPDAALLGAAELPPAQRRLALDRGRAPRCPVRRPFGLCQQFDLLSIGAMSVIERTFNTGARRTPPASRSRSSPTRRTPCGPARCSRPGTATAQDAARCPRAGTSRSADHRRGRAQGQGLVVPRQLHRRAARVTSTPFGMVLNRQPDELLQMDHGGQDHNYRARPGPHGAGRQGRVGEDG